MEGNRPLSSTTAPDRPYHPSYLSSWWAWRDFSGGVLGGGGSHSINVVFMGLKLGTLWEEDGQGTIRIEADAAQRTAEGYPHWQTIRYEIPARGDLPPLTLYWHNGSHDNLRERGVWERVEKIAGRDLVWTDNSREGCANTAAASGSTGCFGVRLMHWIFEFGPSHLGESRSHTQKDGGRSPTCPRGDCCTQTVPESVTEAAGRHGLAASTAGDLP